MLDSRASRFSISVDSFWKGIGSKTAYVLIASMMLKYAEDGNTGSGNNRNHDLIRSHTAWISVLSVIGISPVTTNPR